MDSQQQSRRKVTIALFVATFLAAIEGTIVGTAMPSITGELQGIREYSWVISIYLLATVVSTPVYGKLSDLYGRKRVFMAGAVIFLAGSMLSGIAQSMTGLIGFRALQGLGAGALTTIPHIIIGDMYSFEQRAKVQGWMSSIWGIAGISGPLLGGLLVDFVSWRAIFYMNLPFGIAALYMLAVSMKEKSERPKPYIDFPGIAVFALAMSCLLYAVTLLDGSHGGQAAPWSVYVWFAASAILLALFGWIESRSPEPIIPLRLFKMRVIAMSNLSSFLLCVINVVVIFYLPLWIQGVTGKSATYSGIFMIPLSVGWPLGSILAGNLISKLGLKTINLIGAAFLLAGSWGFASIDAGTPLFALLVLTFLSGLSFGLILTSLMVAVTSAVGWQSRGAAVSGNNLIRTLGQTFGITMFGLLLHTGSADAIEPDVLETSLRNIFSWAAWISLGVALISLLLPKLREEEQTEARGNAS